MDLQSDSIKVSDETESAIREYHTNGASVIRGILDQKWISTMREAIQRVLDHPGSASVEYTPKGEEGRYYGDFLRHLIVNWKFCSIYLCLFPQTF